MSHAQDNEWFDANQRHWDERVPIHVGSRLYDVAGFKAGGTTLREFEVAEVGDVAGKDLLHLQCHFGMDTLSWARRGARVTGLDLSGAAIEAARDLAAECGLDVEFVQANTYDALPALGGRDFDVVYTGLGALNWLPDLARWSEIVATLVRPGGIAYIAEFHPFQEVFGDDDLTVDRPYFGNREPTRWDAPGSYADLDARTVENVTYEWTHPVSEVIQSLLDRGLLLESFREHDSTLFRRWPFLVQSGRDTFRLPPGMPSLPLMYSIRLHRPWTT